MDQVIAARSWRWAVSVLSIFWSTGFAAEIKQPAPRLSFLHGSGTAIVDETNQPVILRGCNLGNWLLLEPWMLELPGNFRDQAQVEQVLVSRFGVTEKDRLLDLYRENWITQRDFEIIKAWNFNVVRLPFNHTLLEDDANPGELKPDALRWLDRAVEMAAQAGIYVILDMHGAPGGQSLDGVTGKAGRNQFWKPENRKRGAFIWQKIAEHFRDNPTVAAYDLLNEPFGMMNSDNHDADLVGAMEELADAIRTVDNRHLILFAGSLRGIEMYAPKVGAWKNIGLTEHFYPGIYSGTPTLETHARFIGTNLASRAALLKKWKVPYLAGEFNVVFDRAGGAGMMQRYFGEFSKYGWAGTLWSYKLLKHDGGVQPDHWYMVTNKEPLKLPQLSVDAKEELSAFFTGLSSMEYEQANDLREALVANTASSLLLTSYSPIELPSNPVSLKDWTDFDVGNSFPKGGHTVANGIAQVLGGGRDIYEGTDEFHFVGRSVKGSFDFTADVSSPAESNVFAKSGLMFRASVAAEAPLVMVNLFPSGKTALAYRKKAGERITEEELHFDPEVTTLRLTRRGTSFHATAIGRNGKELSTKSIEMPEMVNEGKVGFFVLSHDAMVLSDAKFAKVRFETSNLVPSTASKPASAPTARSDEEVLPAAGPYGQARVKRNISYLPNASSHQNFDLYLPKDKAVRPFPLIVWMHGGAWMMSNKEWNNVKYLIQEGYAIASVDYRLSNEAAFPAQIQDCNAALNFLLTHAADYEIDPARFAIGGASAGGHLALLLGLARHETAFGANSSKTPVAILDFFGPSNLAQLVDAPTRNEPAEELQVREHAIKLLQAPAGQLLERARKASPISYVNKKNPPVLILHGTRDNLVPVAQSEELHQLLNTAGVRNELVTIENAGHDGDLFSTPTIRAKVIAFLKEAFSHAPSPGPAG